MKRRTTGNPDNPSPRRNEPIQHVRDSENGPLYGSRALSEEILAVCRQPVRVPAVDNQYIQAVAKSRGRSGEQDVREFSARQFGRENQELEAQSCQLEAVLAVETAGAARHCKEISAELEKLPPTIVHHHEGQPWTRFSKVMVFVLLVLSVAGLAMGINTNATVLMSTGIPAFEHPIRAYLYSMVPVLLAVILKSVSTLWESQTQRRNYTFAICAIGAFFGILWAASFAKTFPGLTQSAADLVERLTAANPARSTEVNSGWMVFISILAEAFCAAGCWLIIQVICDRHQKTVVESNPTYESRHAELDAWNNRRNENRRLRGQLSGKLNAINDARRHFIEDCVGHFYAALKLDDNGLKDFVNE